MSIVVTVVDINEAPHFVFDTNALSYTAEIAEDSVETEILFFTAVDEDSGSNGMITYLPSNLSCE